MNSFRERIIAWIESHDIKAHACAAGVRHAALLDGGGKLIVEYDPLDPLADAMMILPLRALPHDQHARAEALSAMLHFNRNLISSPQFAASLYHIDGAESICLLCAAPALPIEPVAFEDILGRYLNSARAARRALQDSSSPAPPPSGAVRYL